MAIRWLNEDADSDFLESSEEEQNWLKNATNEELVDKLAEFNFLQGKGPLDSDMDRLQVMLRQEIVRRMK